METVKLYPSKGKTILLLLGSLVFVAGGVFLIMRGESAVGWMGTVFFGLAAVVAVLQMTPGASSLELRDDGFTQRTFSRAWTVRWRDVQAFSVGRLGPSKVVMIDLVADVQPASTAKKVAHALAGHDGCLNDSFGLKPEALAALLQEWKHKCRSAETVLT